MIKELISFALIFQIFVLVNPLSSFPILMEAWRKKMNVRKIAFTAVFIALTIALLVVFFGPFLFNMFGISVDSFKIAGGIVLLLLGLDTIRDKQQKTQVTKVDSLISIIATPLLTGPATISFITIKAFELGKMTLVTNILAAFVLVGAVFICFSFMISRINQKIVDITSKILGLFLMAVAIEMITSAVINLI